MFKTFLFPNREQQEKHLPILCHWCPISQFEITSAEKAALDYTYSAHQSKMSKNSWFRLQTVDNFGTQNVAGTFKHTEMKPQHVEADSSGHIAGGRDRTDKETSKLVFPFLLDLSEWAISRAQNTCFSKAIRLMSFCGGRRHGHDLRLTKRTLGNFDRCYRPSSIGQLRRSRSLTAF